ncbi:hypothetical protein [Bradyrhizobium liaoningense]|uniref:hypothetical protein n=1 Tax=Bradyrhizobium liaoningense TaxID=43992 RepID=UPI001BA6CD04|nr:hypothetical protein [Bradyrhizobium liaoningense]MBR0820231.1 hypothetical protein [Bradyrhizobium liaoningense]
MGAVTFLMVGYLAIPYRTIILAAIAAAFMADPHRSRSMRPWIASGSRVARQQQSSKILTPCLHCQKLGAS